MSLWITNYDYVLYKEVVNAKKRREMMLQKLWFLEEVVADSPGVSSLEREQLSTCNIEDLPPVVPHSSVLRSIRFRQMWPNLIFALDHFGEPVLQ